MEVLHFQFVTEALWIVTHESHGDEIITNGEEVIHHLLFDDHDMLQVMMHGDM
jgi:hypothetical protein